MDAGCHYWLVQQCWLGVKFRACNRVVENKLVTGTMASVEGCLGVSGNDKVEECVAS